MSALALQLIRECFESKSKILDLGDCGLNEVPSEILEVKDYVEHLNLARFYNLDDGGTDIPTKNNFGANNLSNGAQSFEVLAEFTRLRNLSLFGTGINSKCAQYIGMLQRLTYLDVSDNQLGPSGAKHIGKLTELKKLVIWSNNIGDKGAEYLGNLKNLDYLDVFNNSIREVGAEYISRLYMLTELDISLNNIGRKGAGFLSRLRRLETLNISNNDIRDEGAESVAMVSSLVNLTVNTNNISEKGAAFINRLSALLSLDISGNKIGEKGAKEISKLISLNYLNIVHNNIGDKGAKYISELKSLTQLSISLNSIGESGAQYISELQCLTQLDISHNAIGEVGAEYISKMIKLVNLNAGNNNIGDIGVNHLSNLKDLTILDLNASNLSDISCIYVSRLKKLKELRLSKNNIKNLPIELVRGIPIPIVFNNADVVDSNAIFLIDNQIESPPAEVVKKGRDAILEFLEGKLKPLNECKVIFVGQGEVGKTTLMTRLVTGKFDSGIKLTHGINKIAWRGIKTPLGEPVRVNLWDFGGQHIQHSLHQFFFTKRVVYVVVLNPRNDEKANYWLDQIDKLGADSTVIVVYNWKEKKDKQAKYLENFYELRKTYPKLQDPILLNCKNGEGMEDFEAAVTRAVMSNEGLKTQYPEEWFNLKQRLEKEIPVDTNYIYYPTYEKWCEEEHYNDSERRKRLLEILNDTGSIVFFNKPVLNQLQVLNPEWITTGAYAILTSKVTDDKHHGHLKWDDLIDIFKDKKEVFSDRNIKIAYKEEHFQFILELMLEYGLCQKNPFREHEYLIPSAFGEKPQKDYEQIVIGARYYMLQFKSEFEMMIMHRFIAKNILNLVGEDYWQSGIYFKHGGRDSLSNTYALVETNKYSKQIACKIIGENIRGMWEVIRNDFRDIFKMYHNFPVEELVQYASGEKTVFLPYSEMLDSLKNGVRFIEYHHTYKIFNIDVLKVIDLFEDTAKIQKYYLKDANMGSENRIEVNPTINVIPSFQQTNENSNTTNVKVEISKTPEFEQMKELLLDLQEANVQNENWKNTLIKCLDELNRMEAAKDKPAQKTSLDIIGRCFRKLKTLSVDAATLAVLAVDAQEKLPQILSLWESFKHYFQ